jgi:osmotically-inducible protein OsmY
MECRDVQAGDPVAQAEQVGGSGKEAPAMTGSEASPTREQDQALGDAVRDVIEKRDPAAARHISITVSNGVVHLWGIIGDDKERADVRNVVAGIPGVTAVEDHRREWLWSG